MLKYIVNSRNIKISYKPLDCLSIVQDDENGVVKFFVAREDISLTASTLSFIREDGSEIQYNDEKMISDINDTEYVTSFFADNVLSINSAITFTCSDGDYIILLLDNFHYLNTNRDGVFPKFVLVDDETPEDKDTICDGDYFIKDSYFLYRYSGGTSECINVVDDVLYWRDAFGNLKSTNVIVPCNYAGKDMKQTLLVKVDSETQDILYNYNTLRFWVKDKRFFKYSAVTETEWNLSLQPGAVVRLRKGDMNIDIPVNEDFYPALMKEDGVDDYLKAEAEKKITPAIDYEKQQFVPVCSGYDVTKIVFPVHILEKDDDWNTVKNGKWLPNGYNEIVQSVYVTDVFAKLTWNKGDYVDNTINWYESSIEEWKGTGVWRSSNRTKNDDIFTLPALTFDNDDIYYRKKKVSETFLRLSFYDTPNRAKQKLLYTCKIYLNANKLWTTYVDGDEKIKNCHASFECTEKNDYNSSTEGFYLHLFPSNLRDRTEDSVIYMKAELNNAKYGKTVPLSLPISNGKICPIECTAVETEEWLYNDNRSYTTEDEDGNVYTDMSALTRDMYIKINIRYNPDKFRYEWEFPILEHVNEDSSFNEEDKSIILPLYEPRIDYVPHGNN